MLIDCSTCIARDIACADCVVTVLLSSPPARPERQTRAPVGRAESDGAQSEPVALDEFERGALSALAGAGLVPPLRLVRPSPSPGLSDTA